MTQDEIIELARQADLVVWRSNSTFSDGIWWIDAHEPNEELKSFAQLVAAKEREACAKICETLWDTSDNGMSTEEECYGEQCAAAIRARGEA